MSKSNTPSKNRTPKSNYKKEKWLEDEESDSFSLSSDSHIRIDPNRNIIGLRISGEKPENITSGLISNELNEEIFFISPETMQIAGILVGDLCKISNGENIKVGITWPRQSQRLSSVILSNSILKDLKPADGDSVIVSKLDRRYSEGTI